MGNIMNDYDRMSFLQLHENENKSHAAVEATWKISEFSNLPFFLFAMIVAISRSFPRYQKIA